MPKINYKYEKRQKDLDKINKRKEKEQRKQEKKNSKTEETGQTPGDNLPAPQPPAETDK